MSGEFDCDVCQEKGSVNKRGCFIEDNELWIKYPNRVRDGHNVKKVDEERLVDSDSIWELLQEVMPVYPTKHPYQLLGGLFSTSDGKRICPVSVTPKDVNDLYVLEEQCSEYKFTPWEIDPNWDKWLVMEYFACIRSTKNRYEQNKMEIERAKNAGKS